MTLPPPSIAHLKSQGCAGVTVSCSEPGCRRLVDLPWSVVGLPEDTPFPRVARLRRFVCSGCGRRSIDVVPDWRAVEAPGAARR